MRDISEGSAEYFTEHLFVPEAIPGFNALKY